MKLRTWMLLGALFALLAGSVGVYYEDRTVVIFAMVACYACIVAARNRSEK